VVDDGATFWVPDGLVNDVQLDGDVAWQLVALTDDQFKFEEPPGIILDGLARREQVGDGIPIFTVTLSVAVPPGPVQVMVYVLAEVRLPVESPMVLFNGLLEPDQSPEAVQLPVVL